jgi:hypothetical protein
MIYSGLAKPPSLESRRLTYDEQGNKIEWVTHPSGEEIEFLIQRGEKVVRRVLDALSDKLWWNQHQVRHNKIVRGEIQLSEKERENYEEDQRKAEHIERKYGRALLAAADDELMLLAARIGALEWTLGDERERCVLFADQFLVHYATDMVD